MIPREHSYVLRSKNPGTGLIDHMLATFANYRRSIAGLLIGAMLTSVGGCARNNEYKFADNTFEHYKRVATETKFADVSSPAAPPTEIPLSITTAPREFWDLPLQEALQLALQNSQVMRDLGGLVLRSPQTARSVQVPAITELDPRFGVEAALSEFDANFAARTSWEKNDRAINNLLLGGGTNIFTQDLGVAQYQLQKRSVTGATFTARHTSDYDANNAPANLFGSAWNTNFEGEIRQPLLQNAGVEINRLNGANGIPGQANGVLIARANTDIAIADFEIGVRDMVSNVENAYWDLYFAYRDLMPRLRRAMRHSIAGGESKRSRKRVARGARPTKKPKPASNTSASKKKSKTPSPAGSSMARKPTTVRAAAVSAAPEVCKSPNDGSDS